MKYLIFILMINFIITSKANDVDRIARNTTAKYEHDNEHLNVVLPCEFGKPFIINDEQLKTLNENEIYQIDLVYTAFKRDQDFDQEKLNNECLKKLKTLIPEIDKNTPMWNYVKQTKAKDYETAVNYFHGFVIHYRERSIDHEKLSTQFKKYRNQTEKFYLNNNQSKILTYASGTQITIPEDAVTYADGSKVEGEYEIVYCEFRNSAEIALSGLPMKYEKEGENYNFTSLGMYEIRGEKDGKTLKLQKPITVDFNCTNPVDQGGFYTLSDETGE